MTAVTADVLVAAGDIGIGLQAIPWLEQCGKPVIYVTGNHEYYGGDIVSIDNAIRANAAQSQIHFLQNESLCLDDVRFIGTTLWTDLLDADPEVMRLAQTHMNDYQQIRYDTEPLTPARVVALNRAATQWLARELARPFSGKTVVVTHHAPSLLSWSQDDDTFFRAAYCNNLRQLTRQYAIDLWIHGHVHAAFDYRIDGVRVVCNPRGYTGYQTIPGFDIARSVIV